MPKGIRWIPIELCRVSACRLWKWLWVAMDMSLICLDTSSIDVRIPLVSSKSFMLRAVPRSIIVDVYMSIAWSIPVVASVYALVPMNMFFKMFTMQFASIDDKEIQRRMSLACNWIFEGVDRNGQIFHHSCGKVNRRDSYILELRNYVSRPLWKNSQSTEHGELRTREYIISHQSS